MPPLRGACAVRCPRKSGQGTTCGADEVAGLSGKRMTEGTDDELRLLRLEQAGIVVRRSSGRPPMFWVRHPIPCCSASARTDRALGYDAAP